MEVIKAVIATTPSPTYKYDARRTDVLHTADSLQMIAKQLNEAIYSSSPIKVFDNPPVKESVDDKNSLEGIVKKKKIIPNHIGNVVKAYVNDNTKLGIKECCVEIYLLHPKDRANIKHNKNSLCFFPWIGYNNKKSLKKAFEDENKNAIYNLYPPLKIIGLNQALKRSSSNPFLTIL